MAGNDPDEIDPFDQSRNLEEILERYDAWDFLPFVDRIMWLYRVRETLGMIPPEFKLTYEEINGLCILKDEIDKKAAFESWKMSEETRRASSSRSG